MISGFIQRNPMLMRLYKNAGILFAGNASGAALGFFGLAILTRALGIEVFGVFALLTAFVSLIDRLVSFQTWQALIHFGAKALHDEAHERLSSLLLFGWLLDIASGVLGCLFAVLGLIFIPQFFGLESIDPIVFFMAASVLALNWVATPTAVLRLFDKFAYQAIYANISGALRLLGYSLLWLSGCQDLAYYILIWALSLIASRLYLFSVSVWLAWSRGLLRKAHFNISKMLSETPKLWHFVLTTNLDGIVRVVRDLDIFLVNGLLGPSSAGLYKIAREIARIPSQFTGPFYQAIYPDLTKLITNKDFTGFLKLMRQSSLTLGGLMLCGLLGFAVAGPWFIEIVFGAAYAPAYGAAFWCIGSTVIWAFAQPLSPAMLSLGKVQSMLMVHSITSFAYLILLWFTTTAFGLLGAGIALFIFYGLWASGILYLFMKHIKTAQEI